MAVVPLAPKCDITALSDDEAAPAAPLAGHCAPEQLAAAAPKRDSEGRSKGKGQGPDLALLRSKILRLQGTLCTCSRSRGRVRSCFGQFSGTQFDAIVDMNIRLRKMVKEDMDLEAWTLGLSLVLRMWNHFYFLWDKKAMRFSHNRFSNIHFLVTESWRHSNPSCVV